MSEIIKLYPGIAPGSEKLSEKEAWFQEEKGGIKKEIVTDVVSPDMIAYIPKKDEPMSAVIIIAGGAFKRQAIKHEGKDVAEWLNEQGIAAFVLKTRLPVLEHENRYDVVLMDAQRAVRMVRAHAKEWNIREDSIGVMGFSAGGFQAALVATGYQLKVYEPLDKIDVVSPRPDFAVLCYPVIEKEARINRGDGTENQIEQYEKDLLDKYKPYELIHENTPPLFIFETDRDKATSAENSLIMYSAARAKKVSAELHIFSMGEHGFGLGEFEKQAGQWKELFLNWAEVQGIV